MENRIGNIIIQSPGGTAAKSSSTYKLSIPTNWVRELGITPENRQVVLSFDGKSISVSRQQNIEEFLKEKSDEGHALLLLSYFNGETLCSKIAADTVDQTLCVENYSSEVVKTAFGNNLLPTWDDFQDFLEERCIPRDRAGVREYLEVLGLDAYDPLQIIKKTSGRMAEDQQWLKVELIT